MDRTLAILKPDCVRRGLVAQAIGYIEKAGFRIVAVKKVRLSRAAAEGFYAVHKGKHFYEELLGFITSGPCVPMVLEKDDAVNQFRELIGPTNPKEAPAGTVRGDLAESTTQNIVHGSDSPTNAEIEIHFFFSEEEILRGI